MLFSKLWYLIMKLALRQCFVFSQTYQNDINSSSLVYSLSFNRTSLYVASASGALMLDFTVWVSYLRCADRKRTLKKLNSFLRSYLKYHWNKCNGKVQGNKKGYYCYSKKHFITGMGQNSFCNVTVHSKKWWKTLMNRKYCHFEKRCFDKWCFYNEAVCWLFHQRCEVHQSTMGFYQHSNERK